jgi:TonB family protein
MAATSTPPAPEPAHAHAASPLDPLTHTLAFLQPWIEHVPKTQRRLGLFIFLALLVHLSTFFFIRIDTTRAELSHPARSRVTVQDPPDAASESASGDRYWDDLSDPRLFLLPLEPFSTVTTADPALDFAAINAPLGRTTFPPPAPVRDRPEARAAATPLADKAAAATIPARQPFTFDETPPAIAHATTWEWSPDLLPRQPVVPTTLPSPVSDTELVPTQIRLAIDPDGSVEHALIEQSCGNLELDQQAVLAARKIRFLPDATAGLQWGRVTIAWNYTAPPREVVEPTPPSAP